ncbi:MAG: glycosyltransferase family 2 protein [Paracoccaceae bacterium]
MNSSYKSADPRISVIMAVHNIAEHLGMAIESILEQTFRDFEFVIVDDGSTDQSPAILAGYAKRDSRVRVISQEKSNHPAALNAGIGASSAPLIARMDADDVAMTYRLSRQLSYLDRHEKIVCLGTSVKIIDGTGKFRRTRRARTGAQIVMRTLPKRNVINHPTVMMRRDALEAVGGYCDRFNLCEDYDLWLRLLSVGEISNLSEPLLNYRKARSPNEILARRPAWTCMSVAAAGMYFARKSGLAVKYNEMVPDHPSSVAAIISELLNSDRLGKRDKKDLVRHALRFLRYVTLDDVESRQSLLTAAKRSFGSVEYAKMLYYNIKLS